MPEQIFGEITEYPEGSLFTSRMEIKDSGLHKYHTAGISRKDDYSFVGRDGSLTVHPRHNIGLEYIRYHRDKYKIASRS